MKKTITILCLVIALFSFPFHALAVELAPGIIGMEIVQRLTKVETKLDSVEQGIQQLRKDMKQLREDMNARDKQLREDMNAQNKQLREDMNAQFDRMASIMVGIIAAFAAIVAATIGFAFWDRRTMIRPFETRVKEIEEKIAGNQVTLHSLLDALRTLSKTDVKVAEVLRSFNLL